MTVLSLALRVLWNVCIDACELMPSDVPMVTLMRQVRHIAKCGFTSTDKEENHEKSHAEHGFQLPGYSRVMAHHQRSFGSRGSQLRRIDRPGRRRFEPQDNSTVHSVLQQLIAGSVSVQVALPIAEAYSTMNQHS